MNGNEMALKNNMAIGDMMKFIPAWLRYLVGAFPGADVNLMTFAVYEQEFEDVDQAAMLEAAKFAVKQHRWNSFPTLPELHEALAQKGNGENWLVPFHLYHKHVTARNWPMCPECGERTPDLKACPFCADMAAIRAEEIT